MRAVEIAGAAVALAGLAAGGLHVLSGPDHLAAVAPLVADRRDRAWATGVRWGLGHAGGVLLVGLGALALRGLLPVDRVGAVGERLVGVVLIGIGLGGLRRAFATRLHVHAHTHGGARHAHVHWHGAGGAHGRPAAHAHTHVALAVGTLHGLAGGSHVLGVLPAVALPTLLASATYLAAFGAGTVLAMAVFAAAVAGLADRAAHRGADVHRGLVTACATAAILVGGSWLIG